jgi:hypothetical protein
LCLDDSDGNRIAVLREDTCHAALAANKTHSHSQNLTPTSIGQRPSLSVSLFTSTTIGRGCFSRLFQTRERASHC